MRREAPPGASGRRGRSSRPPRPRRRPVAGASGRGARRLHWRGAGGPAPTPPSPGWPRGDGLHVTLDLRGYAGTTYARRIVSGWVLPSADNWGLARFKLRLLRLNVNDDDSGLWRLWVNTNNASSETFSTQEWVQILDGPIELTEDFGDCPWETGLPGPSCAPAGARSLGPDLLRYPHQFSQPIPGPRDYGILFHTTGYENHTLEDDDAGTVLRSRLEPGPPYHLPNDCTPSEQAGGLLVSGCQHYTADVEVVPGPPLPPAVLSDQARELADQYVLRCGGPFCSGKIPGPLVAAPLEATPVDPLVVPLGLRAAARDFDEFDVFEPAEREAIAVTDITIADFYRDVVATQKTDPATDQRGTRGGVHVQEGLGIGRLNGVPGATVRWKLVDNGPGGEDTAAITVWDAVTAVLDASGRIKSGRIQSRGHTPPARAPAVALTPLAGPRSFSRAR